MSKYKSQTANFTPAIILFLIATIIINVFTFDTFSRFIPNLNAIVVSVVGVIAILFFILSKLQSYEILNDKIIVQHVTKFVISFNEIEKIVVLSQNSYVRVRKFSPNAIRLNNKLIKQTINSSLNVDNIEDIGFTLDSYNKETTVAKLNMLNTKVLFIQTTKGEFRILPSDPNNFLIELADKYRENQNKDLIVKKVKLEN